MLCFFSFFPRAETRPRDVAGFDIAVLSDTAAASLVTGLTDSRERIEGTFAPSFGVVDRYLCSRSGVVPLMTLRVPVQGHRRLAAAGILDADTIP